MELIVRGRIDLTADARRRKLSGVIGRGGDRQRLKSIVGARTFASSDGGEDAMLTIDWLFAS